MKIQSQENPHIDVRFNIASYEQYLKDNEIYKFNKICMTEVVNADMMIACFDEEKYYKTSAEILAMGNAAYKMMGIDHLIHVYIHSYKTFMAVANDEMSDEDFYKLMKTNHEQYELIRGQETGLGGVSRFAIAFGDNLVNRCVSAYYVNKDLQNNFIEVSNEKEMLEKEQNQRVKIFDLISNALENDRVVPYFQGIYDNRTGSIKKYEALMRIIDEDGKVYAPGHFLAESKNLKLYLSLSKTLIDKALKLFENKNIQLNINLSLHDIQSDEFRQWLLERIMQHPIPERVTIEFVETENYCENNYLFEFLLKAKELGCRIAVDDFGVGYATYSSIMALRPHVIKIDGDIIKTLATNEDSRIILNSICYMARLIGTETVAEFVENEEIQNIVIRFNVDYSQGYHFSKPMPIEDIVDLETQPRC